jgi:CRISPR/Cas system-associated endonuclease Cas1
MPLAFLDDLAVHRIPLLVHRRNLPDPYVFVPGGRRDDADILSAQIRARDNQTKCAYVARTLIRERFRGADLPVSEFF